MKVYIVLCKYDGCGYCGGSDAHIVGASLSEGKAKEIEEKHSRDNESSVENREHYHGCYVDTIEVDLTE